MFEKILEKWLLRGTKKHIEQFIESFSKGGVELNGLVLADVTIAHCNLKNASPDFEKLLNSKMGENIGEISRL